MKVDGYQYIPTFRVGRFRVERWNNRPRLNIRLGSQDIDVLIDELPDLYAVLNEALEKPPLVEGAGWRDIAADMLREGKIKEALDTIFDHSGEALEHVLRPEATSYTLLPDGAFTITQNHVVVTMHNRTPNNACVWLRVSSADFGLVSPPIENRLVPGESDREICGNGCGYEAGHSGRCSDDEAHP